MNKDKDIKTKGQGDNRPRRVRLPGFVIEEDLGLGTAVKRLTSSIGIRPCGGCEQRGNMLNRWLVFSGSRR